MNKIKKPIYRYCIFSKVNKKLVINPDTKKIFLFKYPKQTENFIVRRLGDLRNFDIIDIKKIKR